MSWPCGRRCSISRWSSPKAALSSGRRPADHDRGQHRRRPLRLPYCIQGAGYCRQPELMNLDTGSISTADYYAGEELRSIRLPGSGGAARWRAALFPLRYRLNLLRWPPVATYCGMTRDEYGFAGSEHLLPSALPGGMICSYMSLTRTVNSPAWWNPSVFAGHGGIRGVPLSLKLSQQRRTSRVCPRSLLWKNDDEEAGISSMWRWRRTKGDHHVGRFATSSPLGDRMGCRNLCSLFESGSRRLLDNHIGSSDPARQIAHVLASGVFEASTQIS